MYIFMTNYICKAALFFGQINYLFSLFELLFSYLRTLELCSVCHELLHKLANFPLLDVYLGNFHLSLTYATCLHLFLIFLWSVKMNPLSCLLKILPYICLSIFNSTFCITDHTTHIHHSHASKCPIFSSYAAEIPSTHHQSLYLFHMLKKYTRDKY